ncbi:MAG: endonuclease MutS2 [Gemmatimonadaceae bacterium]
MNPHALAVLEYRRALDGVAERCASSAGAAVVRGLLPTSEHSTVERLHQRVAAVRSMLESDAGCPSQTIPDLGDALPRLTPVGSVLSGPALVALATLLRSSRLTSIALADERHSPMASALLADVRQRLISAPRQEERLTGTLQPEGTLRDDASPTLRRLRRDLRGAEGELIALLERAMARLEPHQRVADMSVTMRNGRWVIPVRRDARAAVGGLVHDTSATGNTLFVEPPAAIEACNRMRELEAAELEESERILAELSDAIRPLAQPMADALAALIELDTLRARARYALDFQCEAASFGTPAEGFRIVAGRHPLLLAQGVAVVPFTLSMEPNERTLLVSGPNTGGKTVLLKSVGLFAALAQSGIPVPVGAGSRLAIFDELFADIGDEQSIEASLSTFSAHVKNLAEILQRATDNTLVLIDELGSGTDPVEGAALGAAILEELTARGTLSIASTHLGALKELAAAVPGVVNASLEFDEEALAPTYRFSKGIPGRSYGLCIARRLALPAGVLSRAEERVPRAERDVNALLAVLESREAQLAARERDAGHAQEVAQARAARLGEREKKVRERERGAERQGRQDARRYLLDARAQIEGTIAKLKKAHAGRLSDAASAARRDVEQLAQSHAERLEELEAAQGAGGLPNEEPLPVREGLAPGDLVEVASISGRAGRLVELRTDSALVAFDSVKVAVPLGHLRRGAARADELRAPVSGDVPEVQAASEVDVRGLRVVEIDELVMQAVDAAIRADLKALRIIHGKGTGALRARVGEMLQKDSRVKAFRLGNWNEGGAGVTVAEL